MNFGILCKGIPYPYQNLTKIIRVMKLTAMLLTVFLVQVSSAAYPQQVSLDMENASLRQVFSEIRKQTGYQVLYSTEILEGTSPVTLRVQNVSIDHALKTALEGQPLSYRLENKIILITARRQPPAPAPAPEPPPQKTVKGKVANAQGEALPGVTVRVKGTTLGTTTDENGNFTLNVPDHADTLLFNYIGYSPQELRLGGRSTLNVVLQEQSSGLDEVVVVGYGTQKKAVVTAAISTVDQKTIRETPGASLQNLLTGKVSGYFSQQRSGQPGSDAAEMTIRGVATYNGGVSPLILVDDVEYNLGQFQFINVDEVASISILKDAEATAIYGVKGANGVILVTTKRGKTGKPSIEIRSEAGVQVPVRTLRTLRAYDAAVLTNEALVNDGLAPLFDDQDLELYRNGTDPYGHPDVDWYNTIYRQLAPMTQTNLNFSGGAKRVRYFLSMGYLNQGGLLKDIPYKGKEPEPNTSKINNNYYLHRYKFRSNLDIDVTNSLKVKLDLTGTLAETNQPTPNVAFQIFQYDYTRPYGYPVYNPDGSFGYPDAGLYQPRDKFNNIAALMSLGGYSRSYNNFMNAGFTADQQLDAVLKGLSVKGMATYSYANTATRSQTRSGIPAYYYNPEDGSYTPRDVNIYRIAPYTLGYGGGTPNHRLNLQASLNYSGNYAGGHNVNMLLLYNQTSYFEGAALPFNFRGYTYRFGYNYKERYIFSASGAYNGSDRFITQKRFNLFPAFALAWNLHNERFFQDRLPFVQQLKLRGSVGVVGNDNIGNVNQYFFEEKYVRSGGYAFGETPNPVAAIIESDQGNNDVSWETERKWNFGIDLALFNNKVSVTADYFHNYRYDILTRRQTIPRSFGVQTATLPYVNLGEVQNAGYELNIRHNGTMGKVGYNIGGMMTFAKNKVLFRDDPPALYPWQDRTGMPIGTNRQYIWEGSFYTAEDLTKPDVPKPAGTVREGFLRYRDLNGDGIINVDDMAYTGRPNLPSTVLGITLGINYKGFNISALFQSNLGADSHTSFDMAVPFKAALQPLHMKRWTPETAATAQFPALTSNFVGTYMNPNGNLSTFWTQSTDYIRLRSVEMGYTFPQQFSRRLKLSSLRLFANGYNLFTWSKFFDKYQYDPEVAANIGTYVYPVTRIFNAGLNISL